MQFSPTGPRLAIAETPAMNWLIWCYLIVIMLVNVGLGFYVAVHLPTDT